MNQIEISVVIPTYHRNDLLAQCLDCLAPKIQTLPADHYEVIVTDDGSQTTAEEMIREHYPWAKWVAGPRKGAAANRNNGAKYARGEFIAFTDDDCLPSPSWLSEFASAITPNIDVYEGKVTCQAGIHSPLEVAPINLTGGALWSCNMMIRTRIFQEIGGFNENYPFAFKEDEDLRERLKKAGFTFPFIERAIVDHPPKKRMLGFRLGKRWESLVYYLRFIENRQSIRGELFKAMLRHHQGMVLYSPVTLKNFQAIMSLIAALIYIGLHMEKWNKKYLIP